MSKPTPKARMASVQINAKGAYGICRVSLTLYPTYEYQIILKIRDSDNKKKLGILSNFKIREQRTVPDGY